MNHWITENWPFGPPWPQCYYDPRTTEPLSKVSLHAKCIVIDENRALVTSANFTDRGQHRNIEVGVLIEDQQFAKSLVQQWHGLVESGGVEEVASLKYLYFGLLD